jgi:hypothetical protein
MSETYEYTRGTDSLITDLSLVTGEWYPNGIDGRTADDLVISSDVIPETNGEFYRSSRLPMTTLTLYGTLVATSKAALRALIADKASALRPNFGKGRFKITLEDASTWYTPAIISKVEFAESNAHPTHAKGAIVFKRLDPVWYSDDSTVVSFTQGDYDLTWFSGSSWFPFVLVDDSIYAQSQLDNDGDLPAWPVWTITGPGTLSISIVGSDESGDFIDDFAFSTALVDGDSLEIDTRPNFKTVTLNGVNAFDVFSGSLFALPPGTSLITISLTNATTDSIVQMSYETARLAV